MQKKVPTPLVKKQTVKKNGWKKGRHSTFEEFIGYHFEDGPPSILHTTYSSGKTKSIVSVQFSDFMYCCGIYEMGSFSGELALVPVSDLVKLVDTIATTCRYTLVLNVIQVQEKWFEAFQSSKYYKLVNDYTNPNSGNRVYTFMSIKE